MKLDLVPRKLCKEMGKDLKISLEKEICAGHKIYTSRHEYYGNRKSLSKDSATARSNIEGKEDEVDGEFSFEIKVSNSSCGILPIFSLQA